jgi:hypothetical protein
MRPTGTFQTFRRTLLSTLLARQLRLVRILGFLSLAGIALQLMIAGGTSRLVDRGIVFQVERFGSLTSSLVTLVVLSFAVGLAVRQIVSRLGWEIECRSGPSRWAS